MNIRDLHYLVTLSETRHFRKAADIACVSQPTLSSQIKKLEESLGIALFERNSRNVALTPAGQAVAAEARAILSHVDTIADIAAVYRDPLAGQFRLGVIASLSPFLTPDLMERLQYDAPRLSVVVQEGVTDQLIAALNLRELDAVLMATDTFDDGLSETALFDEPFLLAHAPDHRLAALPSPTLADVRDGNLLLLEEGHCLRDQALSICMAESVDIRLKATSLMTLIRMAEFHQGVTLLPALAAPFAPQLMLRPLTHTLTQGHHAEPKRRVRLVARRNFSRFGALDVIASAARSIATASNLAVVA